MPGTISTLSKSSYRSPKIFSFDKTRKKARTSNLFQTKVFYKLFHENILLIDLFSEFLMGEEDGYPYSVKSHVNLHSHHLSDKKLGKLSILS